MKIGIVGLGKMGLLHTGILNTFKDVQITSIAEKEKIFSKYMKSAMSTVNVYDDYEKMFNNENLDILYITSPTPSHFPIMLSCIEKGTNFFVEKPLTTNLKECKQVCSKLKNTNIIHGVGFNVRFVDTFSKVKSLLDLKILGDISQINSSMFESNVFSKPSGWRFKKKSSGGGVLLQFGCHLIDLLLWYFGPIKKLAGQTKSIYTSVDDFAHFDMEFENGIKGKFDTSWSVPGYRISEIDLEIKGNNGKLRVNQDFIDVELKKQINSFPYQKTRIYKQSLNGNVSFDVGGPDYTKQDTMMIECVKEKKLPMVNAFEASKTQSVIQAVYDSADTNSVKKVEYLE